MAFLRGWSAICAYTGWSRRQCQRYVTSCDMPVQKVGKNVLSSPALLDDWLRRHGEQLRERKRVQSVRLAAHQYAAVRRTDGSHRVPFGGWR